MKEDLVATLQSALQIVNGAKLPPHLEPIGFGKAIDCLLQNKKANGISESRPAAAVGNDSADDNPISPLETMARKLQIDRSSVGEVFAFDQDKGFQVIVGAGKLGSEKKAAMRLIALLVAGGRQVGELEEWTKLAVVRQVCEEFGRLDEKNFSTVVKGLDDIFGYRGKGGTSREMRINRSGWEELKTVIARLSAHSKGD